MDPTDGPQAFLAPQAAENLAEERAAHADQMHDMFRTPLDPTNAITAILNGDIVKAVEHAQAEWTKLKRDWEEKLEAHAEWTEEKHDLIEQLNTLRETSDTIEKQHEEELAEMRYTLNMVSTIGNNRILAMRNNIQKADIPSGRNCCQGCGKPLYKEEAEPSRLSRGPDVKIETHVMNHCGAVS